MRAARTHKNLVKEVLNKLLLERPRGEQAVEISAEEFGHEVAVDANEQSERELDLNLDLHVLEGGDEDVAQANDLWLKRISRGIRSEPHSPQSTRAPTFSCFKCFSSFSSRYVRLERTGVLKGFMIFLTATAWPVS